ncbi:MAG: hypothetical protein QOI95_2820 [Acidimicrobiaceae bacterium]|jgi:uncharacterized protein YndB with AHSA1/START domain
MIFDMRVTRDVVLDCSTTEAWGLLTDRDELAAWLGRPVDFEINVIGDHRLGFAWCDGDRELSSVEFVLEEVEGGTLLTVTETPMRASVAGGIRRLPIGTNWDDRLLDLELLCLTRSAARV